jgi:hypothetical protein
MRIENGLDSGVQRVHFERQVFARHMHTLIPEHSVDSMLRHDTFEIFPGNFTTSTTALILRENGAHISQDPFLRDQ